MPPLGGIIFAFLLVVIQSAFCRSAIYILACIRHSAPDLGINLPIALTQYLQNDLLVSC